MIELGSIGGDETLLLVIKPEIYLVGGVRFNQAVMDAQNPNLSPAEKLAPPEVEKKWPVDPKTGKGVSDISGTSNFWRIFWILVEILRRAMIHSLSKVMRRRTRSITVIC